MSDDFFRWVIAIGVFLALTAFVVQTVVVLAMFRVIQATQNKLMPMMEALTPLVMTVRRLVDDNAPKFSQMATEAGEIHMRGQICGPGDGEPVGAAQAEDA